jgi:hypothetical protein
MEVNSSVLCPNDPDIIRQVAVAAQMPSVKAAFYFCIKMDNLFKRMYTRVSPSGALHGDWMVGNFRQGLLERLLDTSLIGLPLPS